MFLLEIIGRRIVFILTFLVINSLLSTKIYSKNLNLQIDTVKHTIKTETFDVHINNTLHNSSSDCLSWYTILFNPSEHQISFIPSFPSGLFIFFKGKNECNLYKSILDLILSLPNFDQIFNTENILPTKLYSIEDIFYVLNTVYERENLINILSNVNIFSPDHSELFSTEDEELKYVNIPLKNYGQLISMQQSKILFGISDSLESINYLKRVSVFNSSKKDWKTNVTVSKFIKFDSKEQCIKDFEVIRKLDGSGYHWNYETKVITKRDLNSFVLFDVLPREVFLDIDEITQKNGDIKEIDGKIIPLHPVHIERPSDESRSSLLLSFGYKSVVPIHMRYQSACSGCNYKEVKLINPNLIVNASQKFKDNTCVYYTSELKASHKGNILKVNQEGGVIIRVPVGNSDDINYVFIATLIFTILTTTTLGFSIIKY
ncbi:hypothetical protein FG386_000308 [Cryptosporidium ryanae]|uniref:uncharacterized protein n=1 Tax=Cryptosporidium ryanae TaxID=515981 RepID=UPI00351A3CD1|nr:hypothetical protein FG386_000308 [Cryptosporidium ryanae]